MEEARRKDFAETIEAEFQAFCKSNDKDPTPKEFIEYLINRNLVKDLTIKRFLVVTKYPNIFHNESMGIKDVAMWNLENLLGVSYSSIRVYLDRHIKDFRYKNRLIRKS